MSDITIRSMRHGLADVAEYVLTRGHPITVRGGQETIECIDVGITLTQPEDCVAIGINRNFSSGLAAVEALQLIGGVSHPELMGRITPNTLRFRDGGAFNGAYGPRIGMQLPLVVQRLKDDPTSRQAVVTIWDPLHDLVRQTSNDFPCTLSFQFLVRNGMLDMITTMRSNDVWLGFTFDVVQFTQLQWTVANALGIPAGVYRHRAGSLHVYVRDIPAIKALTRFAPGSESYRLEGLGRSGDDIHAMQARARALLSGEPLEGEVATRTEMWMARALGPFA